MQYFVAVTCSQQNPDVPFREPRDATGMRYPNIPITALRFKCILRVAEPCGLFHTPDKGPGQKLADPSGYPISRAQLTRVARVPLRFPTRVVAHVPFCFSTRVARERFLLE